MFDKDIRLNKIGNSADINISLYKLLKLLDIKSNLVVASTRDNGVILPETPVLNKLNNVIVAAYTDGNTLLLDATEEYSPFDILPFQDLNWQGRIVKEDVTKLFCQINSANVFGF